MRKVDVVIIGAGAAGLFCGIHAGRRGRSVIIIEHNQEVGRKIVISGGGRCNFTNRTVRAENFISSNPHFAKSALSQYTPDDFIALVRDHGIAFYEKTLGQLFCRTSSREIVSMLLDECRKVGVKIITGTEVKSVRHDVLFTVSTASETIQCESLVIATGGLSFPKVGASSFGYDVARQFGHSIVHTRPSLVPLTFNTGGFSELAGISVDAEVSTEGKSFRENILFTHRGLSGPAILQISNYWKPEQSVSIDLLPDIDLAHSILEGKQDKRMLENFLSSFLPKRLSEEFTTRFFTNRQMAQLSKSEIETVCETLKHWRVQFGGTEGYDKAEVTLGGVDTSELSSKTMESSKVAGLYFIGEVVDVTGWLGGYNFQWAWSSGFVAGTVA
ncbi:MAG: NAD(P)/FAD-dependent oxidoreductase [Acidobacteriota bacterium]